MLSCTERNMDVTCNGCRGGSRAGSKFSSLGDLGPQLAGCAWFVRIYREGVENSPLLRLSLDSHLSLVLVRKPHIKCRVRCAGPGLPTKDPPQRAYFATLSCKHRCDSSSSCRVRILAVLREETQEGGFLRRREGAYCLERATSCFLWAGITGVDDALSARRPRKSIVSATGLSCR